MLPRVRNSLRSYYARINYASLPGSIRIRSLSSAKEEAIRTHSQYEVINNVAVFRYNTPNSKHGKSTTDGYSHFAALFPDEQLRAIRMVNAINQECMNETKMTLENAQADPNVKAIVVTSTKPDCFVAGVDLKWMEECQLDTREVLKRATYGQNIVTGIDKSPKPYVAAVQGICLGAGLEIVLACDYRICVDSKTAVFGLPEFMLGLLPGCGGTLRLPAQLPWLKAVDLILSGKTFGLEQAKKWGIIDHVIPALGPGIKEGDERSLEYMEGIAIKTALDIAEGRLKVKRQKSFQERLLDQALRIAPIRNYVLNKVKSQVLKKTHGLYPGPIKILDVFRTGLEKGEKTGLEAELKAFSDLWVTKESRGLRSLYHGQIKCKKNRFGEPEREVKSLAVLGAGLMGAGIVQVSIAKNLDVVLKDTTIEGLTRGENHVQKGLDKQVKRKRITSAQSHQTAARLKTTLSYEDLRKSDMVIEAVFEDLELKRRVLREVEAVTPDHCIFATNTSAIPLAQIVQASKRPEKDTIAAAVNVGLKQGRVVIVVRDCPGFYTSRLAGTLYGEGGRMLQEGEDPKKLDQLSKAAGFPFGIVSLYDEIGLDVALHAGRSLQAAYGERLGGANLQGVADLVAKGFLGRKSGKGFFLYSGASKNRPLNDEAMKTLMKYSQSPKGLNSAEDIKLRLVTRFANEAIRCLQENILASPVEGDIGAVFGLGFPPFTGGPFRFTDTLGASKLVTHLEKYQAAYGAPFEPCELLRDYAKSDKKFYTKDISPIY